MIPDRSSRHFVLHELGLRLEIYFRPATHSGLSSRKGDGGNTINRQDLPSLIAKGAVVSATQTATNVHSIYQEKSKSPSINVTGTMVGLFKFRSSEVDRWELDDWGRQLQQEDTETKQWPVQA